ncbi:MAG: single-stranded DNA-binding protein [Clostridiales bacterium]|nr:single-stranded DNA-binding protein [Clostridiales bacterium]
MNHYNISGVIATQPELKKTEAGTSYCRFRIYHDNEKNGANKREYYTVVAWKKEAENICKTMKKDSPILVSGYLRTSNFTTEAGTKTTSTSVFVEKAYNVNLLGSNNLNYTNLMGRLTAAPVHGITASGKSYCKFTIAVDRREVDSAGNRQADFIKCIAWNKKADAIAKYFDKGYRIALGGHLRQEQQILEQTQEKIEFVQCVVDDFNYIEKKMDKEVVISKAAPDVNNPEKEQYFTDPETGLVFPVEHELTPEEKKLLEEFRESLHENPSEPVVEQSHDDAIAILDEVIEDDNEIAGPDEAL